MMSLHLTSQEKSRLINEEKRKRRIARLIQVRAQMANSAEQIRETVLSDKTVKLNKIKADLCEAVVNRMREINSKPTKSTCTEIASPVHRTHFNTVSFRLTTQEKRRLIENERKKRRIARLLQVRAQTMSNTKGIRRNLLAEKNCEQNNIRSGLRKKVVKDLRIPSS
uniref:Uncharacterized protein n=1 Tax=Heterorhabditis bacteriophora TaxID=37862 RepID=A0A1I7XE68_HETBA